MTEEELRNKVTQWDSLTCGNLAPAFYQNILHTLDYYSREEWSNFLPIENSNYSKNFIQRLAKWVGNVTNEDDQKLIFEYALQISFFSLKDFYSLYLTAFNRIATEWLTRINNLNLTSGVSNYQNNLKYQLFKKTWFCPVTDSMNINEFYKINQISGIGEKPPFLTLYKQSHNNGNHNPSIEQYWLNYMLNPDQNQTSLEHIVLLEDFVGSGNQCKPALEWALNKFKKPILFIPLILCPNGSESLKSLETKYAGQLTVKPTIQLSRCDLLGPERKGHASNWNKAIEMESLVNRIQQTINFKYAPFGYESTGCGISHYKNTPDNSLPLIHDNGYSNLWSPLFPRVMRDL